MSIPPFRPPIEVEAQMLRERDRELAATAARYAQLHPEDPSDRAAGPIRRAFGRARAALRRRQAE